MERDGLQECVPSRTGSYKGAATEPTYGGAHRDSKADRHKLNVHRRQRRHHHNRHEKSGQTTRRMDHHWGHQGPIRLSRATKSAYEQQHNHHNNRDTQAKRLLTYTGHVYPVLLATEHTNEASADASPHRIHVHALRSEASTQGTSSNSLRTASRASTTTPYHWTERIRTKS